MECVNCKAIIGYGQYELHCRDNQACIKCRNCGSFIKIRFNPYGLIELVDYSAVSVETAIDEEINHLQAIENFIKNRKKEILK